ncbi:uncharacterized protein LOC126298620 [Schistocerca gregaria]|uniref:uncharacterized protein LOC126298620 n=1 Tax=Schistocerca gregaria TaxID=7010 RepID=UPI00211EC1F2|nr:uncharacterized protein LOC126298620 [Schistocerca gregaria]
MSQPMVAIAGPSGVNPRRRKLVDQDVPAVLRSKKAKRARLSRRQRKQRIIEENEKYQQLVLFWIRIIKYFMNKAARAKAGTEPAPTSESGPSSGPGPSSGSGPSSASGPSSPTGTSSVTLETSVASQASHSDPDHCALAALAPSAASAPLAAAAAEQPKTSAEPPLPPISTQPPAPPAALPDTAPLAPLSPASSPSTAVPNEQLIVTAVPSLPFPGENAGSSDVLAQGSDEDLIVEYNDSIPLFESDTHDMYVIVDDSDYTFELPFECMESGRYAAEAYM